MTKRIFSGIQATGQVHIGNYLGAIKNWVELQDEYECIFGVVDYHSITVPFEPKKLTANIRSVILDYLAAGIDPQKSSIMIQSHVPEHTELAWILGTITPFSWLERIPTFKEKKQKHPKYINLGMFAYPVLMAADILIYQASHVPVGEDQLPHIELTRTIARKFNQMFNTKVFIEPEAIVGQGARIMGLDKPQAKMSKSLGTNNYISLVDSPDTIREKIKIAVTDSGRDIKATPEKPAMTNLLTIYHLFSGKPVAELEKAYVGKGYAEFKKDLAEVIIEGLRPLQEKRKKIEKEPGYVEKVLKEGETKARAIAQKTMAAVKKTIGVL
jgi:tryptophanyl-tRNA synthetase